MDELNGKRKENADVKSDVKQREKELRFQVSLKSREVTAERTKTNINMEEIKEKQVESHKIWMKKQLDELAFMDLKVQSKLRSRSVPGLPGREKCSEHWQNAPGSLTSSGWPG